MKRYRIGITVHNFEDEYNRLQLQSLLKNGIIPDFIIFHQNYFKRQLLQLINVIFRKRDDVIIKSTIEIFNIKNINSKKSIKILEKFDPSIIIANSGYINHLTLNNLPNTIFLNSHASKLPNYRGVSNIEWALWNNDDIYVTIHRINSGIDEGDVLYQEKVNIDHVSKKSISQIKNIVARKISGITTSGIKRFLNNELNFEKQSGIGVPAKQYYSIHPILKGILEMKIKSNNNV